MRSSSGGRERRVRGGREDIENFWANEGESEMWQGKEGVGDGGICVDV